MSFRLPLQITRKISQYKSVYPHKNLCKVNRYGTNIKKAEVVNKYEKGSKQQYSSLQKCSLNTEKKLKSDIQPKRIKPKKCNSSTFSYKLTQIPGKLPASPVFLQHRNYQADKTGKKGRQKVREEHECDLKEPEIKLAFRQTVKEECKEYAGVIVPDQCPKLNLPKKRYNPNEMKWKHECPEEKSEIGPPRMDQVRGYNFKPKKLPKLESFEGCEKCYDSEYTKDVPPLKRPKRIYDETKMKWKHTDCEDENLCNYEPPRMDDVRCWKPKRKKLPSFIKDSQERSYSTKPSENKVNAKKTVTGRPKLPENKLEYVQFVPRHTQHNIRCASNRCIQIAEKLLSTNLSCESRRFYSKDNAKKKSGKSKIDCKEKKPKKPKCPKFPMPGCPPPARTSCVDIEKDIQCTKIEAPYASFTDCNPQLPEKEITECDMATINMKRMKAKVAGEVDEEDIARRKKEEACKKEKKESICILGKHKKIPKKCPEGSEKCAKKPSKAVCVCDPAPKPKPAEICEPCDSKPKKSSEVCKKPSKKCDPCSSTPKEAVCSSASSDVVCKGEPCTEAVEQCKSPCDSKISASSRNYTSCPCECEEPPKPKKSLWQKFCAYFRARPNCPAPDDWKKQKLRDKARKAAAAAGLEICDPKDACEDPCKLLKKPNPNPCTPICTDPCGKKKKKSFFSFGSKSKSFSTYALAKREYGTYLGLLENIASDKRKEDLLFDRLSGCNKLSHLFENLLLINPSLIWPVRKLVPKQNMKQNKYMLEYRPMNENNE